jgi:hypothetical protein
MSAAAPSPPTPATQPEVDALVAALVGAADSQAVGALVTEFVRDKPSPVAAPPDLRRATDEYKTAADELEWEQQKLVAQVATLRSRGSLASDALNAAVRVLSECRDKKRRAFATLTLALAHSAADPEVALALADAAAANQRAPWSSDRVIVIVRIIISVIFFAACVVLHPSLGTPAASAPALDPSLAVPLLVTCIASIASFVCAVLPDAVAYLSRNHWLATRAERQRASGVLTLVTSLVAFVAGLVGMQGTPPSSTQFAWASNAVAAAASVSSGVVAFGVDQFRPSDPRERALFRVGFSAPPLMLAFTAFLQRNAQRDHRSATREIAIGAGIAFAVCVLIEVIIIRFASAADAATAAGGAPSTTTTSTAAAAGIANNADNADDDLLTPRERDAAEKRDAEAAAKTKTATATTAAAAAADAAAAAADEQLEALL